MTTPTLSTIVKAACPRCRVPLEPDGDELRCPARGERYVRQDGVPVLLGLEFFVTKRLRHAKSGADRESCRLTVEHG